MKDTSIKFTLHYDLNEDGEIAQFELTADDWGEQTANGRVYSHQAKLFLPKKKPVILNLRPVRD